MVRDNPETDWATASKEESGRSVLSYSLARAHSSLAKPLCLEQGASVKPLQVPNFGKPSILSCRHNQVALGKSLYSSTSAKPDAAAHTIGSPCTLVKLMADRS